MIRRRRPERGAHLVTGNPPPQTQVIAATIFVLIEFSLGDHPVPVRGSLAYGHQGSAQHTQDWLLSHARQLRAYTAMILGAFLIISSLVHLT